MLFSLVHVVRHDREDVGMSDIVEKHGGYLWFGMVGIWISVYSTGNCSPNSVL